MTSTLANMSFSAPTSSCRMNKIYNLKLTTLSGTRNTTFYNNVKAMATGDDSSLQRAKLPPELKKLFPRYTSFKWAKLLPDLEMALSQSSRRRDRTFRKLLDSDTNVEDPPLEDVYIDHYPWVVPINGKPVTGKFPFLVKEGQDHHTFRFNVPGMTKNDVEVSIEGKVLNVKAAKKATEKINGGQVNDNGELSDEHEDWPANRFRLFFCLGLPKNTEFEKIKAKVKDGVLYITIPKVKTNENVIRIDVQ
ncbi:unnamed protein product [Lathyrus sativus]|nr:unnamed protein product [Lathyrus sativus]